MINNWCQAWPQGPLHPLPRRLPFATSHEETTYGNVTSNQTAMVSLLWKTTPAVPSF